MWRIAYREAGEGVGGQLEITAKLKRRGDGDKWR